MPRHAAVLAAVGVFLLCCASGSSAAIRKSARGGLFASRGLVAGGPSVCRAKYVLSDELEKAGQSLVETDASCSDGYSFTDDGDDSTCYADCGTGYAIFQKNTTKCVEKCNSGLYTQLVNGTCVPKQPCKTGTSLERAISQCCPPCAAGWVAYGDLCSEKCPSGFVPDKDPKKAPTTCFKTLGKQSVKRPTKKRGCVAPIPSIPKPTRDRQSLPVQCDTDTSFVSLKQKCVQSCRQGYDNIWNDVTSQYECVMPVSGCGQGMTMCSHYCIADAVFENSAVPTTSCSDLELVLDTIDGKDSAGKACIQDCELGSR